MRHCPAWFMVMKIAFNKAETGVLSFAVVCTVKRAFKISPNLLLLLVKSWLDKGNGDQIPHPMDSGNNQVLMTVTFSAFLAI